VWAKIGIGADDIVFDNPYWQTATQKTRGCQIDYMIQCRNNTVYVCEIKPVLIHVNGVDDSVLEERYFDTVIDFGELWS
jgi:hypothetical protein